jgi:hypothetical protein
MDMLYNCGISLNADRFYNVRVRRGSAYGQLQCGLRVFSKLALRDFTRHIRLRVHLQQMCILQSDN